MWGEYGIEYIFLSCGRDRKLIGHSANGLKSYFDPDKPRRVSQLGNRIQRWKIKVQHNCCQSFYLLHRIGWKRFPYLSIPAQIVAFWCYELQGVREDEKIKKGAGRAEKKENLKTNWQVEVAHYQYGWSCEKSEYYQ
jgi:hypothetical protein